MSQERKPTEDAYMSEKYNSGDWDTVLHREMNATTTVLHPPASNQSHLYRSIRLRHESEASVRESTLRASKAAEMEAMAIARERGIAERHGVLDALAQTLEANARRLAEDEATISIARDEIDVKSRDVNVQSKTLEEMDAEQRGASRWLRREAARLDAEEAKRRAALEAAAEATRTSAQELALRENSVIKKEEETARLESTLQKQKLSIEERELKLIDNEKTVHQTSLELERETRRLAEANETLKLRTADVDARAHSIAAADQAASQRAEALSRRAEKLELAKNEIERSAAEAEARCVEADQRELRIREAEDNVSNLDKLAQEKLRTAEEKVAEAQVTQTKANEALARAEQNEKLSEARLGAELQARRQEIEAKVQANKIECERLFALRSDLEQRLKALTERESKSTADYQALANKERELNEREITVLAKLKELESDDTSARFAELQAREAELYASEQEANALAAESQARVAELEARERKLGEDLEAARLAASARHAADEARREALASQQPWLRSCSSHSDWENLAWITTVAQHAAHQQAKAHEAVRSARSVLKKHKSWTLLPRQVRAALRSGVSLGDEIREACSNLQAAAVRRFLRLCVIQSSPKSDDIVEASMDALRSLASQELVRRRALVEAINIAHYSDAVSTQALSRITTISNAYQNARVFRLRHNRFESLRLRPPAARSRFAAATAHWVAPQFRRLLFGLAAEFNGLKSKNQDDDLTLAAVSQSCLGVFFGRDARHDHMSPEQLKEATRLELRFDDDGDDGRHAPRAACIFDSPQDLVAFFEVLDTDKRLTCLGIANGFITANPEDDDAIENDSQEAPPHEVAIALDLFHQGVLCDLRLRLRALEKPQRHLGSLRFLAEVDSHEEILLPLWRDVVHMDGWGNDIAPNQIHATPASHSHPPDPHPYPARKDYSTRTSTSTSSNSHASAKLAFRHTTGSEWPAPPNFVRR